MARYRKKPVVIEAFQWTSHINQLPLPKWLDDAVSKNIVRINHIGKSDACLSIDALEGTLKATPGDYIIKGVKGALYPCKPDIFEATYDKVEEE